MWDGAIYLVWYSKTPCMFSAKSHSLQVKTISNRCMSSKHCMFERLTWKNTWTDCMFWASEKSIPSRLINLHLFQNPIGACHKTDWKEVNIYGLARNWSQAAQANWMRQMKKKRAQIISHYNLPFPKLQLATFLIAWQLNFS